MIYINGDNLSFSDFNNVVYKKEKINITPETEERIESAYKFVDRIVKSNRIVYGISTGFGKLVDIKIQDKDIDKLQMNLILSHASGIGKPLASDFVRGAMLLRLNVIAKGFSGVRIETFNLLKELLNRNIIPVVPEKGSVGASGDLAPLAHIALTLLGRGEVYYNGQIVPSMEVLKDTGLLPVKLKAKEGLALINGTQVMTSIGLSAFLKAENLSRNADIIGAFSVEAFRGIHYAFDEQVVSLRPHPGAKKTIKNFNLLFKDSKVWDEVRKENRVQDPYSIRCIPQVHGAYKDALRYISDTLNIEINSVTDNPLLFPETDDIISGGNFHGEPVAFVMDMLAISSAEMANISERRIAKFMDHSFTNLPPFLAASEGLNSGFMIAQVAAASLVSENKILAHPASVDSIPTSDNQEDHVSMGTIAARKAYEVVENSLNVIAIEALCAAQAVDFQKPQDLPKPLLAVYRKIREKVSYMEKDRELYKDIILMKELIDNKELLEAIRQDVGKIEV